MFARFVLSQILSDQEPDERIQNILLRLNKLREDLENGKVPLSLLTITKQLTKNPEEYSDKKSQPHVQVALRLKSRGNRIKRGDTVHYIICEVITFRNVFHSIEKKKTKMIYENYFSVTKVFNLQIIFTYCC